jgi:hypothetical protein
MNQATLKVEQSSKTFQSEINPIFNEIEELVEECRNNGTSEYASSTVPEPL